MRSTLERLEKYVDRKGLTVNREKTKVMRFRRGGGRMRKVSWLWKGEKIEEVKEFQYSEYTLQRNGGQEGHIKVMVR